MISARLVQIALLVMIVTMMQCTQQGPQHVLSQILRHRPATASFCKGPSPSCASVVSIASGPTVLALHPAHIMSFAHLSLSLQLQLTTGVSPGTLTRCAFAHFSLDPAPIVGVRSSCRQQVLNAGTICLLMHGRIQPSDAAMSVSSDSESGLEGVEQELLNLRAALGLNYRKVQNVCTTIILSMIALRQPSLRALSTGRAPMRRHRPASAPKMRPRRTCFWATDPQPTLAQAQTLLRSRGPGQCCLPQQPTLRACPRNFGDCQRR